jgi:flagellar biosynthesis/type III secretory pathway chaperone
MNAKIIDMIDILDDETACYREMQRILIDEANSISLSKKGCFDQVQNEKQSLVAKLQQLEGVRKRLVGRLSEAYATDSQPMTVSRLASFTEPPIREKLLARAGCLRTIIGDVHEKNRRNQLMINQYLGLIKGSLKLLTHLIEDSSVYQKPGTQQSAVGYPRGGGRFICGSV